jgi:hypothetical protein
MSCQYTNTFSNVSDIGSNYLINHLEDNLKTFLDWGFLNMGGFVNVNIPLSGFYGGDFSQLKSTSQPGYKDGQVWQTFRKDWVWETGINCTENIPNYFSGIYVNNSFYPEPSGNLELSYTVNYPLGQIIFDRPLNLKSNVRANYSYKWCQIYKNSSTEWKELQSLTFQPVPQINQVKSGEYNIGAKNRIQMPCVVIEPIARSYYKPWQLGASDFLVDQDIMFHVFAENSADYYKIIDILRLQKDKTILLYDTKKVANSGAYFLNYDGSLNINRQSYNDLLKNFYWNKCYFKEIGVLEMQSANKNLFWCSLRLTSEIII